MSSRELASATADSGLAAVEASLPQLRESVLGAARSLAELQQRKKRHKKPERMLEAEFNRLIDVITASGAELSATMSVDAEFPIIVADVFPITWGKHAYRGDYGNGELSFLAQREVHNAEEAGLYGIVNSNDLRYKKGLGKDRWYFHFADDHRHYYVPVGTDINFGVRGLTPNHIVRPDIFSKADDKKLEIYTVEKNDNVRQRVFDKPYHMDEFKRNSPGFDIPKSPRKH